MRTPARWEPVINEVLLASGPKYRDNWGATPDGTHPSYGTTARELGRNPQSWSDLLALHTFTAMAQTDEAALRTALVAVAGQAVSWVFDIDARHAQEAA
jgi:hypothetical protein